MQPVKKGSEEAFNLVTLKVLPKGLSGIETRFVTLDRTWGPGLKTSPTIDVLGMSLCDAHRDLTAPLHPAYSKYLNWTTWLSDGRAEFATSNGQTAEVGRGDIVLFDDSEGDGHAYRVANGLPVKQVFITLAQEVTRYGTGPTGFEAGLEGRAWDEKPKAKL
ncbi:hypothetical protein DFJ74DRAFT_687757 [Hyaloraphidium curvatum]|nr:hypothetical protein DFJ74DRAFT_687757 [Hyaloraphidium curvatum]